jgi:hypothetical protein
MVDLLAPTVGQLVAQLMPWLSLTSPSPAPPSAGSAQQHTTDNSSNQVPPRPSSSRSSHSTSSSARFNPMTLPFPSYRSSDFAAAVSDTVSFVHHFADRFPFLDTHLSWFSAILSHTHKLSGDPPYNAIPVADPSFAPGHFRFSQDSLRFYNTAQREWETIVDFVPYEKRLLSRVFSFPSGDLLYKIQ